MGIDAELMAGGLGEFTVLVGDRVVAEKGLLFFPSETKIVERVRAALTSS